MGQLDNRYTAASKLQQHDCTKHTAASICQFKIQMMANTIMLMGQSVRPGIAPQPLADYTAACCVVKKLLPVLPGAVWVRMVAFCATVAKSQARC
jgi:hypothetical protein